MKKITFSFCLLTFSFCLSAQYIGVKVRYSETRVVDDNAPLPPSRENRMILSFYEVTPAGIWIPTVPGQDVYIYKEGFQYGSPTGGPTDSSGNNYPGYTFTAPRAVAYHNGYEQNAIECDASMLTRYTPTSSELDCGFVRVSHWEMHPITGNVREIFTAPNICLPYYFEGHPYYDAPGNQNFEWAITPEPPYNKYDFFCSLVQYGALRGTLQPELAAGVLPVKFADVRGVIDNAGKVTIAWSNLTESHILHYIVEKNNLEIGKVLPAINDGTRADYRFFTEQQERESIYRIKAVEISGKAIISPTIRLVRTDKPQNLSAYPNPGKHINYKLVNAVKGRYIILLVDTGGKELRHKIIMHGGGDLAGQMDLTGLTKGNYQLVIRSSDKKFTRTIHAD